MSSEVLGELNVSPRDNENVQKSDGYHILAEHCISLNKVYILDLDVKRITNNELTCAVSTSEDESKVFIVKESELTQVASFKEHSAAISSVLFAPDSVDLLYTSSLDGKVKLWDLRIGNSVRELKSSGLKPLTCMDVSTNGRLLCAGTELVEGDSFLLFWDIRSRQLLGGYWESHTEEITGVSFHPSETDTVASCSTDGLINVFDLRESSEDDAFQACLNSEESIEKIRWQDDDVLSATTQSEAVQIWRRDGAAPEQSWRRGDIGTAFSGSDDAYVVDVHTSRSGKRFIVAGSRAKHDNLSELCALCIDEEDSMPLKIKLPLVGNRQITRVSSYLSEDDLIITGGEGGCLTVWKQGIQKINSQKKISKIRNKQNKLKPY